MVYIGSEDGSTLPVRYLPHLRWYPCSSQRGVLSQEHGLCNRAFASNKLFRPLTGLIAEIPLLTFALLPSADLHPRCPGKEQV